MLYDFLASRKNKEINFYYLQCTQSELFCDSNRKWPEMVVDVRRGCRVAQTLMEGNVSWFDLALSSRFHLLALKVSGEAAALPAGQATSLQPSKRCRV
jgi:hypothetical protein